MVWPLDTSDWLTVQLTGHSVHQCRATCGVTLASVPNPVALWMRLIGSSTRPSLARERTTNASKLSTEKDVCDLRVPDSHYSCHTIAFYSFDSFLTFIVLQLTSQWRATVSPMWCPSDATYPLTDTRAADRRPLSRSSPYMWRTVLTNWIWSATSSPKPRIVFANSTNGVITRPEAHKPQQFFY